MSPEEKITDTELNAYVDGELSSRRASSLTGMPKEGLRN
jgi:anti-sigma factor RsiW